MITEDQIQEYMSELDGNPVETVPGERTFRYILQEVWLDAYTEGRMDEYRSVNENS